MEDDNGLELSLGLSCGGSSAKLKVKSGGLSDTRTGEGDKGNTIVESFKSFLHAGNQNQDFSHASERTEPVKGQGNFFNNLSRTPVDANVSTRRLWLPNNSMHIEADEEKPCQQETNGKRKMLFDEMSHTKKQEKETLEAPDKNFQIGVLNSSKTSHISINTDDGSTAENEDVADSEVEGSTSRLMAHHDESSKRFAVTIGSSEVAKDIRGFTDAGQKRFNQQPEHEFKIGSATYGVAHTAQPSDTMNVPHPLPAKDPNSLGAQSTSGYPLPGSVLRTPSNGARPGAQHVGSGNLPFSFGYSPVHLPMLDKGHTWSLGSNSQQFPPSYAGKGTNAAAPTPDTNGSGIKTSQGAMPPTSTEARMYDGRALEFGKSESKPNAPEAGFASQTENHVKANNVFSRTRDASDQPSTDAPSTGGSVIRPGISANVKFGGSGSHPNLPWVSTTGPGPNGKTISGVTYRYSASQIKIVCACHGAHMTPEEFIQHANEENVVPDGATTLPSTPTSNPSAPAQT